MAVVPPYTAECRNCGNKFVPYNKDGSYWQDDFDAEDVTCPKCGSLKMGYIQATAGPLIDSTIMILLFAVIVLVGLFK